MNSQPIVNCPHCDQLIFVESINCAIFRCAILKDTMQQLNPHAPKEICDALIEQGRIYGCGKPFKIVYDSKSEKFEAIVCDYI